MEAKQNQAGWGFGVLWFLASAIGMAIGFTGGFFLAGYTAEALGEPMGISLLGISVGSSVGLMQWLVLRRYASGTGWWILTYVPAICGLLTSAVALADLDEVWIVAGLVACGGAVTGTFQWLILRKKVSKAGWWILVCAASWGLIMPILKADLWSTCESSSAGTLFAFSTVAAVLGAIMGGGMAWLLRATTCIRPCGTGRSR